MLTGNNRIALSKASAMKTLSNLENAYLRTCKRILINVLKACPTFSDISLQVIGNLADSYRITLFFSVIFHPGY